MTALSLAYPSRFRAGDVITFKRSDRPDMGEITAPLYAAVKPRRRGALAAAGYIVVDQSGYKASNILLVKAERPDVAVPAPGTATDEVLINGVAYKLTRA